MKISISPTIKKAFLELVIIGGGLWLMQFYFENKYAPKRASQILEKENFLNAKKEAYFEAIAIANKVMANSDWGSTDALTGNKIDPKFLHKHQTDLSSFELEVNTVYSKLMTVAADTNILHTYFRIFVSPTNEEHVPIAEVENFVKEVRKDLGNEIPLPEEYRLLYIVLPSNQDSLP